MTGLRALARRVLGGAERLADRRLGAVVLFLCALALDGVRAIGWPLVNGRDLDEYLSYYAQLGLHDPPLPAFMVTHTPVTPILDGSALDLAGGALAQPLLALCFAVSVTAWAVVAHAFGPRVALAVAALLLVYPAYGLLFHELSSEAIFATAFALWCVLLVRAIGQPSSGRFAAVGAGIAALTLVRPGNQILVVLALYPLLLGGSARTRVTRGAALVLAAVIPLACWALVNGARYGEWTVARGAKGALFQHSLVVDRDIAAGNGPATRQLIRAVRQRLLTREPYRSYGLTLDDVLSSGSLRAADDIALTAYETWGWNGGPALLDRAGREAVRTHLGTYVSGVLRTVWLEASEPYYRTPRDERRSAAPSSAGTTSGTIPPRPSGAAVIPGGQNGWIARPDHGIRQVWTSPTSYRFEFASPQLEASYVRVQRRVAGLFAEMPTRRGNASLTARWNQLGRWFPRPVLWLALALVGLAVRRPARIPALLAPTAAGALVVLTTALVAPADVRYLLPMAPAVVLLAAGAFLGQRRRWRAAGAPT
jgi:Dolichyl-phosphate-mannose-protein mannosyltransferase